MSHLLLSALLLLPTAQTSDADSQNWPRFLGPNSDGSTNQPGDLFQWGEEGPEVLWTAEIGGGYGGAAVRDGEVYLLDREGSERNVLRVFDLKTGKEKWSTPYDAPGRLNFPGSRTVPTVEEDYVYTSGGFGQVFCFDRKSGEPVWNVDMTDLYGGIQPMFGWSASPLIVDGVVVTTPLGEDVGLLGLDAKTGEELWVTPSVGYSHSTPMLLHLHGKKQVLFLSTTYQTSGTDQAAPTTIWSFDPSDGAELWRHETVMTRLPIPGPMQIDDERIFLTGGYRGGSKMIRVTKDGGDYAFEELFAIPRGAQIHRPIFYGDHLYYLVNENWNNSRGRRKEGGLLCLDMTGKEVWRTGDDPFFGRGNVVRIGEHLVIQDGFDGILRVAKATPTGYEQVAEADLFQVRKGRDHEMWSPMAVADGLLLVRSKEVLKCVRL